MNHYVIIAGLIAISILGYLSIINLIYFLAPTKKIEKFQKKCQISTNCTRVADTNTRGYGLKSIKLKCFNCCIKPRFMASSLIFMNNFLICNSIN